MTAGLPGLRTVPSPLAPRLQAGADLHVHATHSDGLCSPCEVVIAAAGAGLATLAITDHDTVSALAIARPEAARLGERVLPRADRRQRLPRPRPPRPLGRLDHNPAGRPGAPASGPTSESIFGQLG